MAKKLVSYIICPVGELDSETRRDADHLQELIINPALMQHNFTVERGDRSKESNQIHEAVNTAVRNADLCVADISPLVSDNGHTFYNPNVFYEVGRRMETARPIVFYIAENGEVRKK